MAWTLLATLPLLALHSDGKMAGHISVSDESNGEIEMVGPGEHPYVVAVTKKSELVCVGSLIHESWVISSATCFGEETPSLYRLLFGSYSFHDQFLYDGSISAIMKHPNFDMFSFSYNAAVLKLKSPAIINNLVMPVKLPKVSMMSKDYGGSTGTVVGWRHLEQPQYLPVIRRSEYIIYPASHCKGNLESGKIPLEICVSLEGKHFGASVETGSPLVIYDMSEDAYYLLGMHMGVKPTDTHLKFVRIAPLLSWITNVTGIPLLYGSM